MATATTAYVIRAGLTRDHCWLLAPAPAYAWTQRRKAAARFVGRSAADAAAAALAEAIAGRGCPVPRIAVVPASGGAPCGESYFTE